MLVLRSTRQFEQIATDWDRLADLSGHALLRHEWFLSAARTLHADDGLTVVVIADEAGRLVAAAPLVEIRRRGFWRMEMLGGALLHEPSGFVAADAAARARLMAAVLSLGRPLLLHRVLPDTAASVSGDGVRRGLMVARPGSRCLGLDLTGTSYLERLSGRLRYDIRRGRRRAAELGPVGLETRVARPEQVDDVIGEFAAVESAGWKGARGSALLSKPRLLAFFHEYARSAAALGTLRVSTLRIDGRAAAVQLAVEIYQRLWVLKIGYDEAFARCSPGLLVTANAIEYAVSRGLRSYEFLGAVEPWEERWRPEERRHEVVGFYPWNVSGGLGVALDVATAGWRRLSASWPARGARA